MVLSVSALCQSGPRRFYIDDVSVITDTNATLVHSYVNETVTWNGLSNKQELECLRSQLRETGLFRSIQTRLKFMGRATATATATPV